MSSQSPIARSRSRSVKEEEDRASSSVTRRLSRSDSVEEVRKDPVGESVAMDWAVERTSLRATIMESIVVVSSSIIGVDARRVFTIAVNLGT